MSGAKLDIPHHDPFDLVSIYKGVYYSPHLTDEKETKADRQSELPKITQIPESVFFISR